MRRGLRAVFAATLALTAALALSGCMTLQVNMPDSPAAAASAKGAKKLTAAQAQAAEQEQLRNSVTEVARAKAAAVTKRWVQLMKPTGTVLVSGPAGKWYAAVTIDIPGMDPALFVYRRDGDAWKLLGYGVRKQAKVARPLYGVSATTWKALLL